MTLRKRTLITSLVSVCCLLQPAWGESSLDQQKSSPKVGAQQDAEAMEPTWDPQLQQAAERPASTIRWIEDSVRWVGDSVRDKAASGFAPVKQLATSRSNSSESDSNAPSPSSFFADSPENQAINGGESQPKIVSVQSGNTTNASSNQILSLNAPSNGLRPAADAMSAQNTPAATPSNSAQANYTDHRVLLTAQTEGELQQVQPQVEAQSSQPLDSGVVWNSNDYTGSDGCDGCDGCATGKRCRRRPILVVGTEVAFLYPELNGAGISYTFQDFVTPTANRAFSSASNAASIDSLYIAPRLWLGLQGECWGIMGRYFHFRAGEHEDDPFIPQNSTKGYKAGHLDQGFWINNCAEAYYLDLELTRNFCCRCWKNQFAFGARYASIDHHQALSAITEVRDGALATEGLIFGTARSDRNAHGTGLTFGLNGRRPMFRNSCAHWYYNVRSSILWGNNYNDVATSANAVYTGGGPVTANAGSIDGALSWVDSDLYIGEIQLGVEWNFALRCLPAKALFRAAFEYQHWEGPQGRATSTSFSGFGSPTTSVGTGFADASGLRLDLFGFTVGTGFTW